MTGQPLFEATLTLTFPDKSIRTLDVLWPPTESLIPYTDEAKTDELITHLGSFGPSVDVTAQVVLNEDPSVSAEVDWHDENGFVPLGAALIDWMRKTHPADCAALEDVKLRAYIKWTISDELTFTQQAWWLTTGEVEPRFNSDGPAESVIAEDKLFRLLMSSFADVHQKGTVHLHADSAVQATITADDKIRRLTAPYEGLSAYAQ